LLRRLMDILACPICAQPFKLKVNEKKNATWLYSDFPGCHDYCEFISGEITPAFQEEAYSHCEECYKEEVIQGDLSCHNGHFFPIVDAVPRLHNIDIGRLRTKQTFDVEWKVFDYNDKIYGHSQEEELKDLFRRMVINERFFYGKTVLDAGCGIGRITQSVGELAKEVIGIDFSLGVDEAQILNENKPNVHILQADIMSLPLKLSYFDYVYSKGVLHYVSNVQQCLAGLAETVVSGGELSITIYPKMKPFFEKYNRLVRKITAIMPIKVIYVMSYLLIPFLTLAWKWSGMKGRYISWNERAHMIFNWFASEFQNRATNKEASGWFEKLGFNELRLSDIPVGITGTKKK